MADEQIRQLRDQVTLGVGGEGTGGDVGVELGHEASKNLGFRRKPSLSG